MAFSLVSGETIKSGGGAADFVPRGGIRHEVVCPVEGISKSDLFLVAREAGRGNDSEQHTVVVQGAEIVAGGDGAGRPVAGIADQGRAVR
jgi:hypothetical protein